MIGLLGGLILLIMGVVAWLLSDDPIGWGEISLFSFYLLGATAAGVVAGVFYPWAKSKTGAVVVGMIAIQPFLYGIMLIVRAVEEEPIGSGGELFTWLVMTAVFGPVIGLSWIRGMVPEPRTPSA